MSAEGEDGEEEWNSPQKEPRGVLAQGGPGFGEGEREALPGTGPGTKCLSFLRPSALGPLKEM